MLNKSYQGLAMIFLSLLFVVQTAGAQNLDSIPAKINDSIPVMVKDTVTVKKDSVKPNAIDAPIKSEAKDSIVLVLEGKNMFYLYGQAKVTQENRELTAEYMELNADSSLMYASYGLDSVGEEIGYPVFKEGDQQYEMKQLHFNFKTKRMYIHDVITQQGEGYVTAGTTKRMSNQDLNMLNGKYTTCDEHDHPHFYLQMTRAKVRPGKNVVTGPAYLVVEDVPLPLAIPFGFFPFSKEYSSGVVMPSFGDEMTRGFSLQRGGYYFALSDYIDLKLTGDIYTKGSWGLNAASSYRKRYKYSGSFSANYIVTIMGDKDTKGLPNSDYSRTQDMRLSWSHAQDSKANPFSTFNSSVDFSTSQSRLNNPDQFYNFADRTQNTKSSNVTYTYKHPTKPFSVNTNFSINQISSDSTLNVTFLNIGFTMSQIYPFKRKEQAGDEKWYEKIYTSYTGNLRNSSGSVKENEFFQKNILKDWKNGMSHSIPVSASFNLMKFITVSPSLNYGAYMYTRAVEMGYNEGTRTFVPTHTTYGLFWLTNQFSGSVGANTTLYGMYKPWSIFGKWTKGVQIRHVFKPTVSFSGAPDLSKWGAFDLTRGTRTDIYKLAPGMNTDTLVRYSPFQNQIFAVPGSGKSGTINFSVSNNLEAKIPIAGTDSARKISIIDNLTLGMSYNFLADSLNWSNISASIRLKILGQTLSLSGQFDTYLYDEHQRHINIPRWKNPRTKKEEGSTSRIPRFMGTTIGYPLSLNNATVKKWFGKGEDKDTPKKNTDADGNPLSNEDEEGNLLDNPTDKNPQGSASLLKPKKAEGKYDEDGYLLMDIPWNLSINYSLMYGYGAFNSKRREFDYRFAQTLGLTGNISPSQGWSFSFSTSYNFDYKRFATMQCNITRKMHCWQMTATIIPLGPYQSYNFLISVASSLLKDLKYTQSSNFRDQKNWGN